MLRHLLKLTWKRKSRNLMLSLEILLAFAIVFGIAAFALRAWHLYREPIGFDGSDAWSVKIVTGDSKDESIPADVYDTLRRNLLALPEVREVGFVSYSPYTNSTWSTTVKSPRNGADIETKVIEASDGVATVLGMPLERGRWFTAADEGAAVQPAVIDRRLAAALFPGQDALGRQFPKKDGDLTRTFTVVGVVGTYRNKHPLMAPTEFLMTRFSPRTSASRVRVILLKVAPGTTRAFENRLNRQLKLVRNDWSYTISPLAAMRASQMKEQLIPLIVLSTVAAFMLAMVAFGLFGVLWQNTTRRIPEIGLRRAVGARAGNIYGQIVAEQLLLSSVAVVLALVLLVQLPLTGALAQYLSWRLFVEAALAAMAVIYLLSLLCSLYPGWRASRLSPAEALHHD